MTEDDIDIVFLHGQPGQKEDFAQVLRWLDHRWHVESLDRPGWGANPLEVIGIEANATWVLSQLKRPRVLLIGHSLGATIAVRAAEIDQTRIAALILIAPPVTQSSLVAIDRLLAARVIGSMASALIAGVSLGPSRRSQFYRVRQSFLAEQRHLLGELLVVESLLSQVQCPSLVVAGLRDRVVPLASMVHAAERLGNARMVVLPRAGHDVLNNAPIAVAALVRQVLAEVTSSGGVLRGL